MRVLLNCQTEHNLGHAEKQWRGCDPNSSLQNLVLLDSSGSKGNRAIVTPRPTHDGIHSIPAAACRILRLGLDVARAALEHLAAAQGEHQLL